jgi:hypothetical protein
LNGITSVTNFMEFYQAAQKLLVGPHRQTGDLISLLSFFESRLKIVNIATYFFPVRVHSYLSCYGEFRRSTVAAVPSEWDGIIRSARRSSSPFTVVKPAEQGNVLHEMQTSLLHNSSPTKNLSYLPNHFESIARQTLSMRSFVKNVVSPPVELSRGKSKTYSERVNSRPRQPVRELLPSN